MGPTISGSRVRRVRHEARRREVQVSCVREISPHFIEVTFTGESLADFTSLSFDDHVKFFLNASDTNPVMRDYTPRRYDREKRELVIEFVLHGDGPAATWAEGVQPGQSAVIGGPRGSMIIPLDFHWHLLAGDETAVPAIARRLEELPAEARAFVVIQVADPRDQRKLATRAHADVQWVANPDQSIAAVRQLALPGRDGYAWCAGESSAVRALRNVLVQEKSQDRHAIRAAAYWKHGAVAHHENLED